MRSLPPSLEPTEAAPNGPGQGHGTSAVDAERIVRRHQVGLWRYVRSLGAPPYLADEVTQDAFVIGLDRLEVDRGSAAVGSFLREVARRLLLEVTRQRDRREARLVELADREWRRAEGADGDGGVTLAALETCLGALEGRSREVVEAFYRDGQSREAIGRRLGMKVTGVKTLLQRIRAALRRCVEQRLAARQAANP